jgi:hypothetical protein
MAFSVHRVPGLMYGQHNREVVFLASDDNSDVDAEPMFMRLKPNDQNRMRDKFDSWARGNNGPSHWFHGFNDEGRKYCFVFKRKKAKTHYRYYGFLINPMPKTNPGYRLCVLVNHAQKNTEFTDLAETNFVNAIRARADVIAAVKREFSEKPGGYHVSLHVN